MDGEELSKVTGLSSEEINDAVSILAQAGLLEWMRRRVTYSAEPIRKG